MKYEISIIIPVYNVEKYLHKCINSVLNQTFLDFELILINDGSTDSSGDICDFYKKKDTRVKVIHLSNSGVSKARNEGIKHSTGRFIMFCDSDDYVDADWCKNLFNYAKHDEKSLTLCGYTSINERINPTFNKEYTIKCDNKIVNLHKSEFYILYENILLNSIWNKIYNADILKENNIYFNEDLNLGEDSIFNLKYLRYTNDKINIVNKSLYNYILRSKESLDYRYKPNLFEKYKYLSENLYNEMIYHNTNMNKYENLYWKRYYYKFEVIFENTFHKENNISWLSKMNYNNRVCNSDLFKKSVNALSENDIDKNYLKVLEMHNYYIIYFFKMMRKIKWNYKQYIKDILIKIKIYN